MFVQFLQIILADRERIGIQFRPRFQPFEQSRVSEGKVEFGGVENVDHDDFVLLNIEVANPLHKRCHVVQQVAEEEHDTAAAESAGDLIETRADVGRLARRPVEQQLQHLPKVVPRAGRGRRKCRTVRSNVATPTLSALLQDEEAEGRGRAARDVVLRVSSPSPHLHRLAGVHQHPRDEVRFLLVLLQVVPLGAAVHLPVDVLDVVAGAYSRCWANSTAKP